MPSCILAPPEAAFLGRTLYRTGNLLAHVVTHAAHQETGVADRDHSLITVNLSFTSDNRLI